MAQAERIADSKDPFADFKGIRVGQFEIRQVIGIYFYDGDIGIRVCSDNFGNKLSAVC
ncbi:hypothetical protein ES703_120696 [subsurface metagenome]